MNDDYLACTKAPPMDVPDRMKKGLGVCMAPRNHDGPCEYGVEGGGRAVLMKMEASPVAMVAEIEKLYYKTRRAYRVAFWASLVSAASAGWLLADAISTLVS